MHKKINTRYIVYVLCFLCINAIEFIIETQYGTIRRTAVNLTGLAMMIIIFSAYPLKDFLKPVYYFYTGLCLAGMLIIGILGSGKIQGYSVWNLETVMFNIWWLGLILHYLFSKTLVEKAVSIKPGVAGWLFILLFVLMICSINDSMWTLWFFLMFGTFYITKYNASHKKILINAMIDGSILSFFIVQTYCYGFRPYDEVRYKGAYLNVNAMAFYYILIYTMVLFKLHILRKEEGKKRWKLFYFVGAAGLLCFIFMTLGRTAWLTVMVETIVFGTAVMKKGWKISWKSVIIRGMALLLTGCMIFPLVFATVRWLPTILHHPIWNAGEYSINKVHSFDPPDSEKYVEMEELLDAAFGRIFRTFGVVISKSPFAIQAHATEKIQIEKVKVPWTNDDALLDRMGAFKAYGSNLTFYGHKNGDDNYWIGTWRIGSSHNLLLHIAYFWGIPAGIVFAILVCVMLVTQYRNLKDRAAGIYAGFPIVFGCMYFFYCLAENGFTIGQLAVFLIFFIQHPMFREKDILIEE